MKMAINLISLAVLIGIFLTGPAVAVTSKGWAFAAAMGTKSRIFHCI